jgi:murein DD-endopeptidase MepM/ murein hydrolase activator NlpD
VRLTPPAAQENPATQEQALYIDETRVRPGDTLAAVLQRLDVEEKGLLAFLTHDPSARTIYKLYPGRAVQAARDGNGRLVWLRYHHTPAERQTDGQMMARWLEVSSSAAGFKAAEDSRAMGTHTRLAEGVIQSSLFGATDAAGIPDNITLQMARILGSHVDFARDLRKGDNFRVVYETSTHDGQAVSSGRVLALEFVNAGRLHSAVWFDPPDGSTSGYFDYQGQSLRGMFLRSALEFSRISSTFGMRTHPIHGGWRGHNGVDFAAPAGTPIHATADGEVTFIGQQNGFGNVIHLKHNNRYSTVYAHQSRFAAGLKQGSRVQQDQIIGYVGATGWATGPHLHYEMRLNNAPVNPLSIDVPKSVALEGKPLQAFQAALGNYQQHLQMLARMQDERTAVAQR